MYLRKSRADNPNESVEEVLEKHETILQELAERELGGRIPEHCIFREIVSGETISERPQMMRMMSMIENPDVKGVLVVEPQRLSRGDLEDCGKVVNSFRYSTTEVIAPNMVYDLSNKMQRKFFEQELMRGNDFLEYTKEILLRGRIASIKRGNYIGNIPPFGYDKVATDDGFTLKPNEYAPAVKMAFEMFVNENKTPLQIARHFDSIGIKPYRSEIWEKCSIRAMLNNKHYIGLVYFGTKRTEKTVVNGQVVAKKSRPANPEDFIIAKGKHPAIVSDELFEAAQNKFRNNPRHKKDFPLKNPFAGIMFCSKCGRVMQYHPYKHARTRIECRNRNGCGSKSAFMDDVVEAVAWSLENEHLPRLQSELHNDSGKAKAIQLRLLEKMNKELAELHEKEEKQYDLLESGTYTEEVFQKRNKALHVQMDELKSRIYEARQQVPKEIDYAGEIDKLMEAVTKLRNPDVPAEIKNRLLKAIIKRIDYEFLEHQGKGKVRFRLHIILYV
jgi:hypothetical protein